MSTLVINAGRPLRGGAMGAAHPRELVAVGGGRGGWDRDGGRWPLSLLEVWEWRLQVVGWRRSSHTTGRALRLPAPRARRGDTSAGGRRRRASWPRGDMRWSLAQMPLLCTLLGRGRGGERGERRGERRGREGVGGWRLRLRSSRPWQAGLGDV